MRCGQQNSPSAADRLTVDIDWRSFLGCLDLVWQSVPTSFYDGPFLGNGGLGTTVYRRPTHDRLAFTLGDSRVRDHQSTGGPLWGGARLPIGVLTLATRGGVRDVDLRLSLWDAELSGFVTTTAGVVSIRAFVHAERDILAVSTSVVSGDEHVTWTFEAAPAVSPRERFYPAQRPADLSSNPAPQVTVTATGGASVQDLACGGRTDTRWQLRPEPDGQSTTLLCTVAHSTADHSATEQAKAATAAVRSLPLSELTAEHRAWWHAFYPKSFLSVPDVRLQGFYWIQLYKTASATRAELPVLTTTGPWLEPTPWPAVWWNLNVQLEYWPIYPTGHTELDSLRNALTHGQAGLEAATPAAHRADCLVMGRTSQDDLHSDPAGTPGSDAPLPETGNLLWALHNAWLSYRHTMDDAFLGDTLLPLLRKSVNFYLRFLFKDDAGVYHLPATHSPEFASTRDCNYDLALLHWGCRALLQATVRLGVADPLAATWQDVLDQLTPPPQDADGLRIGRDVALTSSHRHYSHLLWFYPLYQLDVSDPAHRALLVRSLDHWLGLTGALQGYSFTGSASMYALLGDGTAALRQLHALLDDYTRPNTMYEETGPVIETPLSAAQSLHDMLVQSWGGVIRVFPAVPPAWADVAIHDLVTEGAFRVSARRGGGATQFVRVRSEGGEPCLVEPGGLTEPYHVTPLGDTSAPVRWTVRPDGLLDLALARGEEALITSGAPLPRPAVGPVVEPTEAFWGLPPNDGGTPLDLTTAPDDDATCRPTTPGTGGRAAAGHRFPTKEMPPPGLFVSGGVSWSIPAYGEGRADNVRADGRTLPIPPHRSPTALHLLATAPQGDVDTTITLTCADGSSTTLPVQLTDWADTPRYGEKVAVRTTHLLIGADHKVQPVHVLHQTLRISPPTPLVSITLPAATGLHLFGLTLR